MFQLKIDVSFTAEAVDEESTAQQSYVSIRLAYQLKQITTARLNEPCCCVMQLSLLFSLSAVAAEDENKSDDDDPDAVIVKKIAKTVIHTRSS